MTDIRKSIHHFQQHWRKSSHLLSEEDEKRMGKVLDLLVEEYNFSERIKPHYEPNHNRSTR